MATGLGTRILDALERRDIEALPSTMDPGELLTRYATHLRLDAVPLRENLAELIEGDAEADTRRLPLVRPPAPRDPSLVWLGAGAVLGIAGLAVLGGGLGGSDPSPTSSISGATPQPVTQSAPPPPPPTSPATTPETLRPTPSPTPAIELRLGAKPGRTVWVEVRRDDVSGEQVFAGQVGDGVTRRITSARPLWLGVAWAPSVTIALNGEELDTDGGTESYRVTARGITKL